jgi:hypothetical protein
MSRTALVALVALALSPAGRAGEEPEQPEAEKAPAFKLKDIEGKERSLKEFEGKIVVLEWTNHKCPYVVKHYGSGNMQALQKKYTAKGVIWLTICSSAEGKQGWMKPEDWKAKNEELGAAPTATVLDPSGEVGRAYEAKTTPNFCIVNAKGERAYDGAIDDKPTPKQEDIKTSRSYVSEVLDALLEGKESPIRRTKSYG